MRMDFHIPIKDISEAHTVTRNAGDRVWSKRCIMSTSLFYTPSGSCTGHQQDFSIPDGTVCKPCSWLPVKVYSLIFCLAVLLLEDLGGSLLFLP